MMVKNSTILIVNDIDETVTNLLATLPLHSRRIIKNEQSATGEFQMTQANLAIKEAYIASNEPKYIILCGNTFRKEAQNALLKVLEEPPANIVFIIITTSKSTLLPTVLSRLPHKYLKKSVNIRECKLNLKKLDLKEVYDFLKTNQKISKVEAKEIVESLIYKINNEKIKLTSKELNSFSTAIKLLELNSRPINVLTTLLLTLMHSKAIGSKV